MALVDKHFSGHDLAQQAQDILFHANKVQFLKQAVWFLYNLEKDKSYKDRIGGIIPFSIKIRKLYPLLVRWFGEPPAGVITD